MQKNGGTLTIMLERTELGEKNLLLSEELQPGSYLRLRVVDTGEGIPEEVMSRIFDPFFTTKPQGKGTGMGLSMVHGIVGSLGGSISVKSKPGHGTTFNILLPEAQGSTKQMTERQGEMVSGRGKILLVDDDTDLVNVGEQMLGDLGYTVTGVNDSLDAIDIFRRNPQDFDLVITDQTMPHLTGDRLAKTVHSIRPDLPIILYSGFSSSLKHIEKGEHGIREILMKPFAMAELSRAVDRALQNG